MTRKLKTRHWSDFWNKVDAPDVLSCWGWQGAKMENGYGTFLGGKAKILAHRFAWIDSGGGEIPFGFVVCHTCDNRLCCNPNHLFLGTHQDNTQDMIAKGRARFRFNRDKRVLTKELVLNARSRVPRESISSIARELGISIRTLTSAVCGHSWKHLPNAYSHRSLK